MKTKRVYGKAVALILCLSFLFGTTNPIAFNADGDVEEERPYSLSEVPKNIYGLLNKVSENENATVLKDDNLYQITVDNGDGSFTTNVYALPVKYKNNKGQYEFIDTSISPMGLSGIFSAYDYRSNLGNTLIQYAGKASKGVMISSNDSEVVLRPITENNTKNGLVDKDQEGNGTFLYQDVFGKGQNVKYTTTYSGFKEDIILNAPTDKNEFSFELKVTNGKLVLSEDQKSINIVDPKDENKNLYHISSVYMYDSFAERSAEDEGLLEISNMEFRHTNEDGYYRVEQTDSNTYKISIIVPKEFLTNPNTVYPVTIDPTVNATTSSSSIDDTYVSEYAPTTNYYLSNHLRIGNYPAKVGNRCFAYIRFLSLPTINKSFYNITAATLKLTLRPGQTTGPNEIQAFQVTESWTGSSLTWNNRKASQGWESPRTGHNNFTACNFDVQKAVNAWYFSEEPNYGFLINYSDQNYLDYNSFWSSDCGSSGTLPQLSITYADASPIADGVYYIKNKLSGLYLDVPAAAIADGTQCKQYLFNGNANQQWRITNVGGGNYTIRPLHHASSALEVYIGNLLNAKVCIDTNAEGDEYKEAQWRIIANGNNTYRFMSVSSGAQYALAILYASTQEGGECIQHYYNASKNDQWELQTCVSKLTATQTFSAFDVGNSTEEEAELVKKWMEKMGYTSVGVFDCAKDYVPAQTIKEIGQYSDILYVNGHGDWAASLAIQNKAEEWVEYLSAAAGMTNHYSTTTQKNTVIGANFLSGSTTKTNSFWNKKTKWGILAQCSQLNFGDQELGNHWNGLNNAQIWARTMLGNGERIHGYLGYYNGAPDGKTHYTKLNAFFDAAVNDNVPLIQAWKQANNGDILGRGTSNWAAIYHASNYLDRFGSFTATTENGSAYQIYLVSRSRSGSSIPLTSISNNNIKYGFTEKMQESALNVTKNISIKLTDQQLSTEQKSMIKQNLLKNGNEAETLNFHENGAIEYTKITDYGIANMDYRLSDMEAINIAKAELKKLGLLPPTGYRVVVSKVERRELNLLESDFVEPEIMEYKVTFFRQLGQTDFLSDEGDGISVSINKDGVCELWYLWRQMQVTQQETRTSSDISLAKAKEIFIQNYEDLYSTENNTVNTSISKSYILRNGEMKSVWVFAEDDDYLNAVMIDATTGEIL